MSVCKPLPKRIEAIGREIWSEGVKPCCPVCISAKITAIQASRLSFSPSSVAIGGFGACNIRIRFEINEGVTGRLLLLLQLPTCNIRSVNTQVPPFAFERLLRADWLLWVKTRRKRKEIGVLIDEMLTLLYDLPFIGPRSPKTSILTAALHHQPRTQAIDADLRNFTVSQVLLTYACPSITPPSTSHLH